MTDCLTTRVKGLNPSNQEQLFERSTLDLPTSACSSLFSSCSPTPADRSVADRWGLCSLQKSMVLKMCFFYKGFGRRGLFQPDLPPLFYTTDGLLGRL